MKNKATEYFKELQSKLCYEVEKNDGEARFQTDSWEREGGGGGLTKVISQGRHFEKAGVNFSEVKGKLPKKMSKKLVGQDKELSFFATGVSMVFHPHSPLIPSTHANLRYLEVADKAWVGGGIDLTPYYIFEEDIIEYHQHLKTICERSNPEFYPKFKKACDQYFYLPHRKEARGVGGLFFDYLGKDDPESLNKYWEFSKNLGNNLLNSYWSNFQKRKDTKWTDAQKAFQKLRRGRYVEFNLLYDRGTLFGLETNGRLESIFMSMPPSVNWGYDVKFSEGSEEFKTIMTLSEVRDWVN